MKKVTAAAKRTAELLACGERTVWNCWEDLRRQLSAEKRLDDFLVDAAHEAARESAVSSLRAEHGDREFSTEEIYDRMELLEEEAVRLSEYL